MSTLFLRAGLWLSLLVAVLAVLVRFQQPLQEIFLSGSPSQTFCYSGGITAKFSTNNKASCFTVKDGVFVDVLVPGSEPPAVEFQQGHVIPGLWDGVSHQTSPNLFLVIESANNMIAWTPGCIWRVSSFRGPVRHQVHRGCPQQTGRLLGPA